MKRSSLHSPCIRDTRATRAIHAALLIGLAALTAGCAMGPSYTRPAAAVPASWSATSLEPAHQAASTVQPDPPTGNWWAAFDDATLTQLIERSRASNLDLRTAVLRITEARAQRDISAAAAWPSLSANASFTRQRLSESTPTGSLFTKFDTLQIPGAPAIGVANPYNQWQLGLTAVWEPDLFGRIRRSIEAADADLQATAEDRAALLVSLDSDVARTYIDLRGAQLRTAITQANLATERELLELTQRRQAAGVTTDLDVQNAAAQVSSTQAQLPLLAAQISTDINQLSRLMGREPDALRAELAATGAVPPVPPRITIGLPADLTRRRPDIRASEQRLHAATARIGIAMADLFPRLTLSATGGFQSQNASDLLDWASRFGSIGPGFEMPLFDRGRWVSVRLQNARAQEAALDYQKTVLGALHDVENALALYRADQDRRDELTQAVAHGRDALELARQRYESGVTNFIGVLDAQRTVQQNELALAESVTAVSADLVALYKALGGSPDTRSGAG